MFHSPVSTFSPHNSMATGGLSGEKELIPNHDLDENHENEDVNPFARLGAMTQKRRQILTFLETGPIDASKLNDQKILNFKHVCNFELSKENLPGLVSDFHSWFNHQFKLIENFELHVKKLIEKASKDDPLQKSDLNQASCRPKL